MALLNWLLNGRTRAELHRRLAADADLRVELLTSPETLKQVSQLESDPVLHVTLMAASREFDQLPLRQHLSAGMNRRLALNLWDQIDSITSHARPIAKCREELVALVADVTRYHVLVIPPEPDEDVSGMRGTQGVTGELKAQLLLLASRNQDLRASVDKVTKTPDYDDVLNLVSAQYCINHWFASTVNALRMALGDYNRTSGRDWYKPFYHAMCVWAEARYRRDLGWPPAITGPNPDIAVLAYSTFFNTVLQGHRDPDKVWRDHYRVDIINRFLAPPF